MSETPVLDGPRYGPAAGGTATQLIILLHGVGADGRDLIEMAPHLGQVFPNAAFVAPNAPNRYDQGLSGYQWVSSQIRVESEVVAAVKESATILNTFIDQELQNVGIGPEKLALVGFSQGTMMSLYVAPRRTQPIAGVLGYSGRLVGADLLTTETISRPPIFLAHGAIDPVVPVESMDAAEKILSENGFSVQSLRCPNLGHSIDEEGLVQGTQFLRTTLGV
ncbi:MAG: dienelactone hydrolase family protein [Pseudomonadota bacterium]|nr:dienelactone hydrolase family protein [Pseudomonadota bacterium]